MNEPRWRHTISVVGSQCGSNVDIIMVSVAGLFARTPRQKSSKESTEVEKTAKRLKKQSTQKSKAARDRDSVN